MLSRTASQLHELGYALVQLPVDRDPAAELLQFAQTMCQPMPTGESDDQRWVVEIRPRPGYDHASYAGAGEFVLHTDSVWMRDVNVPRLVFLLCVRPDPGGGGASYVADGWRAFEQLSESDRRFLAETPLTFRSHKDARTISHRESPIVTRENRGYRIRFRRDLIVGDVPEPADHFLASAQGIAHELKLDPGDLLIVDNWRMLHGRTALQSGLASNRLLLRLHGK